MNRLRLTLTTWPIVTLLTIGLCYLTQLVAGWVGIQLSEQQQIQLVRSKVGWNFGFVFVLLQVLVILPVLEELLFRFLLWMWPCRRWSRRPEVILAVVSSVIFAASHYLVNPFPDNAFLALFAFGLAQCWLYRRTDRVWCPMAVHSLFNLTNLILLFLIPEGVQS